MAHLRINPLVDEAMHAYNTCPSLAPEDKMYAVLKAVAPSFATQALYCLANGVEIHGQFIDHTEIRLAAEEFKNGH